MIYPVAWFLGWNVMYLSSIVPRFDGKHSLLYASGSFSSFYSLFRAFSIQMHSQMCSCSISSSELSSLL